MAPKIPFNPPQEPGATRAWIFLAIFLLATAAIAVIVPFRENKRSLQPAPPPVRSGGLEKTNIPASPAIQIDPVPAEKSLQPSSETADPGTTKLITQLFDESLPLKIRSRAARELSDLGTDAALSALKSALSKNSPSYLKAAVAEGLGDSPNPNARVLLNDLINDKDEILARGAVRGMALSGDSDAVNSLGGLLFNEQVPLSIRAEAALALGGLNSPDALRTLTRATTEIKDDDVLENVLDGLGKRPFSETEHFFSGYISSQDVSAESKVAAIEALGNAQGDVAPFLLKYLGDPDEDLRAAAAWALSSSDSTGDIGSQLTDALKQETDPNVRTRIYQALENQPNANPQAVLPLVQNESNITALLAGLNFLTGTLRSSPAPEVADFLNQTAVPKLKDAALNSDSSQNRLSAVFALQRAGTPAAIDALHEIAQQTTDFKVLASVQKTISSQSQH
jgi:HEAT repeat protein